jgi:Holliday junction resolvase RusA-like endonuclease
VWRRLESGDAVTIDFVISGHLKPYVRMTQKSKFCDPQAQEYLTSKSAIRLQAEQQMDAQPFDKTPLRVTGLILTKSRRGDLDNIIKAILDAFQGVVFVNDVWVDDIRFIRRVTKGEELASISVETIQTTQENTRANVC